MIHTFLSFSKSHIYEWHALLTAFITFVFMQVIKRPVKDALSDWVEHRALKSERVNSKKKLHKRRANLIIVILSVVVSYLFFAIISYVSPVIQWSSFTAFLSACFALDFYAVYELWFGGKKNA